MSAHYRPVGWTRTKLVTDAVLILGIAGYLIAFMRFAPAARAPGTLLDDQSLAIKAYGTCAFLLLSIVLAIGPLARLDVRFLPLLYNRRHFGVITCAVAATHALAVVDWYLAYSPLSPWVAMFVVDTSLGGGAPVPHVPFGIVAFVILLVLAATSHDFWLAFLTPPVWKRLHMAIYGAYACVVAHVAFGALQDARGGALPLLTIGPALAVLGLHLAAAWRERRWRGAPETAPVAGGIDAGPAGGIAPGRARIVPLPDGEAAAIFNDDGQLFAISNTCAHQNGPLGEGRAINGCAICPWHGFEYRLRDGCAPPPYTERIATYPLSLSNGRLILDPRPNPLGHTAEPVRVGAPEGAT